MKAILSALPWVLTPALLVLWLFSPTLLNPEVNAGPKQGGLGAPDGQGAALYWQVDDVKPGMKGQGRTVIKGTKVETFDAEVLGVLRNTSPGRDMILCRLSGLGL